MPAVTGKGARQGFGKVAAVQPADRDGHNANVEMIAVVLWRDYHYQQPVPRYREHQRDFEFP